MLMRIKRLHKDISDLAVQSYVGERNTAILNIAMYHMNSDVDVFDFQTKTWVVDNSDCAHIVTAEQYLLRLTA